MADGIAFGFAAVFWTWGFLFGAVFALVAAALVILAMCYALRVSLLLASMAKSRWLLWKLQRHVRQAVDEASPEHRR